jgi:tricorn protease
MFRLTLFILLLVAQQLSASPGYYRYPSLYENTAVFTAEGDLWKMQIGDQYAQRLTTHIAEERESAISADGQWIAFVASYDGASEVYVMPMQGGMAKRVSFENVGTKVHGWTTDGKILYSYNGRVGPAGNWTLRLVEPVTLLTTTIPLADAVQGNISTTGDMLYFSQFGLQVSTDNAKAYKGGAKGELWKYALGSKQEATQLTRKHKGSAHSPMVSAKRLYFISNQSGSDNIWSMKLNGRDQRQHTQYAEWAVRSARLQGNQIIYQLGADLHIYHILDKKSQPLDIRLTSDFTNLRQRWVKDPLKYLTSAKQAGTAKKVVLTARGRIAIASSDGSRLIEIATEKDSRSRKALLSHDQQYVYGLNDSSGELEIWQYPADGSTAGKQLTEDGSIFRWDLYLSPDGKFIAHDDKNGDLWLLNLDTLDNKKILSQNNSNFPISSLTWSSNSQLIALTRHHINSERKQVLLIEVATNQQKVLTSEKYESFSPAFSRDSKWLYFLSNRHFNPYPRGPWGDRNMGPVFDRRTEIFAIALQKDAKFAFETPNELSPKSDSHTAKETDKNEGVKPDTAHKAGLATKHNTHSKDSSPTKQITIDWHDIEQRLWQVPVISGNYSKLVTNKSFLYVLDKITEPDSKPTLKTISLQPAKTQIKPKISTFLAGVQDFSVSEDGKSLFVRMIGEQKAMFIVAAGAKFPAAANQAKLATADWKLHIDPRQEWQQIFHDAWLMHRDSFFDKNMRGLDWAAVKQKYQPLLSRLTQRNELNDIFKQMMGELNALHSQVRGGDLPLDVNAAKPAWLGASYRQTDQGVKIEHIYIGDAELVKTLPPLARPGIDAQSGDIIEAINGQKIDKIAELVLALQNQGGKQVRLSLKRQDNSHQTIVVPSSNRADYFHRYLDWVTANQRKVQQADKALGYLHLRAMGANDVATFAREFYAQYKKQGLIIDVRRNNGGNVDSWLIEKLLKRAWSFWQVRDGQPFSNMQQAFRGHLVVLADEFTYSDGETFVAGIKALELGTVIGKQTAGAGVWLTARNRQSDNGIARVAELPVYAMDGRWITEARGISPDIEVHNLPHATFNGKDAQLDAAMKYLQNKIRKDPVKPMQTKPFPRGVAPAADILD